MKKLMLLIGLLTLALLTACSVSLDKGKLEQTRYGDTDFESGVLMMVSPDVVSSDTKTLLLNIENATDKKCTFGLEYTLEVQLDEAWYVVPPKQEISVIAIAQVLDPGGSAQLEALLADAYGKLPEGTYRYVKSFSLENGSAAAAAQFDITVNK